MAKVARSKSLLTKIFDRWDSSDPERAPPPLPLNPQNSTGSPVRPNTSATVAAAAQALAERARENAGPSPYISNPIDRSPEKSPTRTPQHKRLQSLQTGNLKDFKASLERARAAERESPRPSTSSSGRDIFSSSPERTPAKDTPTPTKTRDPVNDTPTPKSGRVGSRSILSENTPPSATMLAIQSMPSRESDTPLANITNSSNARSPQTLESIHSQMQNLTSIATTLQKEMVALSRRSKDNAADLLSLKETTKSRDEDVRKSLKELITTSRSTEGSIFGGPRGDMSRSTSVLDFHPRFPDPKPFHSPPFGKSLSLPRMSAVHNFENGSDIERSGSPSPYSVEGAATVAMLEKIIREMGTKEGQDRLVSQLSELLEKSGKESSETAKKVEELVEFIRDKQFSQAVVKPQGPRGLSEELPHPSTPWSKPASRRVSDVGGPRQMPVSPHVISDELRHGLQRIKDAVSDGDLSEEVKSLIKDLRGEVHGMGRELGKKLENVGRDQNDKALVRMDDSPTREELGRIVQDGLAELKQQMEQMIQTRRRQSSGSISSRHSVDSNEVHALVKQSLAQQGLQLYQQPEDRAPPFDQEAILNAVREAYEAYKPEIELQQFGLERDEILQCLREGLVDYQSSRPTPPGISREEVYEAIQAGMKHFKPPKPVTEVSEIKEEVLAAVKECLADFKPPARERSEWKPGDITRDDILGAVRDGLGHFKKEGAREIEIDRATLFQAVKAGLDHTRTPFGGYGDEVIKSLHDIVEGMRVEFKEYSAANGRDTELVLDSVKDGLESLRSDIQSYVDRAQDVTGKDEIVSILNGGVSNLRVLIEDFISQSQGNANEKAELVDSIKTEFERLHLAMEGPNQQASRTREEMILALRDGLDELKASQRGSGMDGPSDEVLDAIKEEFEQLREVILSGSASHKDEILESIHDSLGSLSAQNASRGLGSDSNEYLHSTIRDEFETLRNSMAAPVLHPGNSLDRDEILNALKESMDGIRVQLAADQSEAAEEALGTIREEVERLRHTINSTIVPAGDRGNTDEVFEHVRAGFDELREHIGSTLQTSGSSNAARDDVLNAVRDGLGSLRADIAKMVDRPVDLDMTVSYDILDALKNGVAELRADIERLKTGNSAATHGDVILAEASNSSTSRGVSDSSGNPSRLTTKGDLSDLEVILTQLQIKIEAMDRNMQNTPQMSAAAIEQVNRDGFANIGGMLRDLQSTVGVLADRKPDDRGSSVSKDDTDAIETLLQNTKAKIDDHIIPSLDAFVKRDHLETVEAVVRMTSDTVDSLSSRLDDNLASKDDVAAVYGLLQEADSALKRMEKESDEKASRTDAEAIETLCTDIKHRVDNMPMSDDVPSKSDVDKLTDLLHDCKASHESLRKRYERDIEITAGAFDDRKEESERILSQIADLKESVVGTKDDLKSRMKQNTQDFRALDEIMQEIEDKIDNAPNAVSDVQEVMRVINREFERAHETMESLHSGNKEKTSSLLEKQDEVKTAILVELVNKLDERFSEILMRQSEQQQTVQQAAQAVASKAAQQDELMNTTRAMAEDLKITIDTLGSSVTAIGPALTEATEKMGDDAKTVFNKVEDVYARTDSNHVEAMTEHQLTREEVAKSFVGIGGLHEAIMSFQPRAMETLSNLVSMVREHYEHSKVAHGQFQDAAQKSSTIEETIRNGFASLPVPRIEGPPASSIHEDEEKLHKKLDEILAASKNDDSGLHGKIDELLTRAAPSDSVIPSGDKIGEIHERVEAMAAEISAFVAVQGKLAIEQHENREREAKEAAEELSRCLSEKEDLELKIENLTNTRQELAADVATLIIERDSMTSQKTRLSAEVSSLETALKIRREELQTMDARADMLERRIIDGVMDHSRALLIAKKPKAPANMNLKRVPSNASNVTSSTAVPSSSANAGLNMALKSKRGNKNAAAAPSPGARRVLSLSQITNNVPTGGSTVSSPSRSVTGGLNNLKRSQTVKNPPVRRSFAGHARAEDFDKENEALREESDGEENNDEEHDRRSSMATTRRSPSYTNTRISASDRRASYTTASSEYSYATGSYLSSSDSQRTSSYGSTIRSMVGGGTSFDDSIDEVNENEHEVEVEESPQPADGGEIEEPLEIAPVTDEEEEKEMEDFVPDLGPASPSTPKKDLVIRPPDGYDSGLGSDLPTAPAMSPPGSDYFLIKNKEPVS